MLRFSAEGVALFLLPFAVYAVLLIFGDRLPVVRAGGRRGPVALMAGLGLGLVILALLGLGVFGERSRGAYVPAHIENGRLVPGRME